MRAEQTITRGEVAALLCQARASSLEARYRVPSQFVVQFKAEDNDLWQRAILLKEFTAAWSMDLDRTEPLKS
ncbi:MAG: hypothetical protein HC771_11025 [Synechococcales cyanobacterium CRU_2_2]|nr:hypothetical protein [Synechococcales cyanobacterium CRU_2_2]